MSRIKELKSNNDNSINIIEILELFSPEQKSKYTDTLLRLMTKTKNFHEYADEMKLDILSKFNFIKMADLDKFGSMRIILIHNFIDSFFNHEDLNKFKLFAEYNERGLIKQNDLTKYKSIEEIIQQLNIAELKLGSKELENEIIKLHEDEEWLLIRPLTYLSSKKYGSNTKWCTTSIDNPEYFLKYSKKGVLIYCINKINGYKVASFYSLNKNEPEFSFWNQQDAKVDSLDTELTDELRKIIQTVSKNKESKTNRFYLSDEQRIKEESLLQKSSKSVVEVETNITRRGRIGQAIRRADVEQQTEVERREEREYEDRENQEEQIIGEPESNILVEENPLARMVWNSTTSHDTAN